MANEAGSRKSLISDLGPIRLGKVNPLKKHIATGASWAHPPLPGMKFSRVGTKFLYTEKEIDHFLAVCAACGLAPHLRRNGRQPDPEILRREAEHNVR